jgi:radical SAM family uncharacterized protein/radical SAM-linked protein
MSERQDTDRLLRGVERPGRYAGGEWNVRRKDPRRARVKVALVFPDAYEIGMSYLGQKILYDILNRRPGVVAERVFAPWPDFEARLREAGRELFSLENRIPLSRFDVLGFSLLYELNASNILTVLASGGVPLFAAERADSHPLVVAGGPAAFNPEPLAEVFDFFFLGDGEEAVVEIVEACGRMRRRGLGRRAILGEMAKIQGVYVPSLYDVLPSDGSPLLVPRPRDGAPARVGKRLLRDLSTAPFPEAILVPGVRPVFDRVAVDTARGCPRNCRFCQATSLYFPHRPRDPRTVVKTVLRSLDATGYEDASLAALSVGDTPGLEAMVRTLMDAFEKRGVSLSLSSLRPGALSDDVARSIARVRKTGFTIVPEAGSERLRRVINKPLRDEDIADALTYAFRNGWQLVKLYFMAGLPTETEEDLRGIARLVGEMVRLGKSVLGRTPRFNVSLSSFIPKPHTPFQWAGMDDARILEEKQRFVRAELGRFRSVAFKDHPVPVSVLEGVFSRGDRRLGPVLRRAWELGARFDSWQDHFDFGRWEEAFRDRAVDYRTYLAALDPAAPLPWDVIDTGLHKVYLRDEYERALRAEPSPICAERDCGECRGCRFPGLKLAAGEVPPAFAPEPETPAPLGRSGEPDEVFRYRATYAKTGPARTLSHIDLIHVIQRGFRRARVEVVQTRGFHPKMQMSYGPALPLGMGSFEEILEFKSSRRMEEGDFLPVVNAVLPEGVRFSRLTLLPTGSAHLAASIESLDYAYDLRDPDAAAGLERLKAAAGARGFGALRAAAREREAKDAPALRLEVDGRRRKLLLAIVPDSRKSLRPQDVVRDLLDVENPVWGLVRERIRLR